jgi:hypothetical protein
MKRNFGQRIHDYLQEPPGEQFVAGKWRFWLVAVVFLSVLNAILTDLIFKNDDQVNYISPIMLSVGALLAWLRVGCLRYSDSTDRRLARGVAGLDSVTLLFVVCHFCGLLWAYGHLKTIQGAERKYEAAAEAYNKKAEKVSSDNVEIARAAPSIEPPYSSIEPPLMGEQSAESMRWQGVAQQEPGHKTSFLSAPQFRKS